MNASLRALLKSLGRATWQWQSVPSERWRVEPLPDGGVRISLDLAPREFTDDRPTVGPVSVSMGPSSGWPPKK